MVGRSGWLLACQVKEVVKIYNDTNSEENCQFSFVALQPCMSKATKSTLLQ